jgi:Methyltransferase domain
MFASLMQWLRNSAKLRMLVKGHFLTGIPLLFPIGHFYSPIVNPSEAGKRAAWLWARHDEMGGIDLRVNDQLALLERLAPYTSAIHYPIKRDKTQLGYYYANDQFPVLDAEFLHTMLCHLRPKTMIEVGSGFSSLITARVNLNMLDGALDFTCIDPYPRKFLTDGVPGISRLIQKRVEDLELSFFDRLEAGDILFIDSSHVAKAGSDVNYLFFEILPRLRKGVFVHFHDIFLPDEYPREWVIDQGRNWNEQYVLRAFLQYNTDWRVVWSAHLMGTRHREAVQTVFPRYPALGGGGSFWIQRN